MHNYRNIASSYVPLASVSICGASFLLGEIKLCVTRISHVRVRIAMVVVMRLIVAVLSCLVSCISVGNAGISR